MYPTRIEHLETDGFSYLHMQDRCSVGLPNTGAVYVFVSHDLFRHDSIRVVYVGKTGNISSRLKYPHPIENESDVFLSCYVMRTNQFNDLEIDFIKRYRPELNIHHNG